MLTIRIPTSNEFWLWLLRFSYRRINHDPCQMPTGIPGNRDPDMPCEAFAPRSQINDDWGDCETDGHYLCEGCAHCKNPKDDESAL
jgi:hypothetical protein